MVGNVQEQCTVHRINGAIVEGMDLVSILEEVTAGDNQYGCAYYVGCRLVGEAGIISVDQCDEAPAGGHVKDITLPRMSEANPLVSVE